MSKAEGAVAVLLTLAAIWLRFEASTSAGALWRDEANTVAIATLPTLQDVWSNLQYDSFPMLWLLIVRSFSGLAGPMNDSAFRAFGFFVGVGVVAAVWFFARTVTRSVPLVSLALLAPNVSVIVWGDSMRAYGAGIALMLLTGALMWRFVEQPSPSRFAMVAVAAIASVHTLFYNSVLLMAFCAGAIAVCAQQRAWKKASQVVLIGAFAAVSMLPYASTIRDAANWNAIVQMPDYTLRWFFIKLEETLGSSGPLTLFVWLEVFVLAVFVGQRVLRLHGKLGICQANRDVTLYSLVTLLVGVLAYFLFLNALSYWTAPWYYLALLALSAVCFDALLAAWMRAPTARIARLAAVVLFAGAALFPAVLAVRTRLTNIDVIAARLQTAVRSGDLVLLNEWHTGVSFSRYYHGSAAWMTIPPLSFSRFHRYDLLKQHMMMRDQTVPARPVIDQVRETLRAGHRVYVVGSLALPQSAQEPRKLPPAPLAGDSWPEYPYLAQWSSMVGYFLVQHATTVAVVNVGPPGTVSDFENLPVLSAQGWRP